MKILSGSKYKGGTDPKKEPLARGKKQKSVRSHMTIKKPEKEGDDDDNDDPPPPPAKEGRSAVKE